MLFYNLIKVNNAILCIRYLQTIKNRLQGVVTFYYKKCNYTSEATQFIFCLKTLKDNTASKLDSF